MQVKIPLKAFAYFLFIYFSQKYSNPILLLHHPRLMSNEVKIIHVPLLTRHSLDSSRLSLFFFF